MKPPTGRSSKRILIIVSFIATTTVARQVGAQAKAYQLEDVLQLVASGINTQRIADKVKLNCIDFPVDQPVERRLLKAGGDSALIAMLQGACYGGSTLEVYSDADVDVLIGGRPVGRTPYTARVYESAEMVIEVRGKRWTSTIATDVPARTIVRVRFPAPEDTLDWPEARGTEDLGKELDLLTLWKSSRPEPPLPKAPRGWRRLGPMLLGGVVLSSVGYGVGTRACEGRRPDYVVDSVTYPGYSLGATSGCMAGWSGGGFATGTVAASYISRWRARRALARYPITLAKWQDTQARQRDAWLERHPAIRTARGREAADLQRVKDANRHTAARNAELAKPSIVKEKVAS